MEEFKKNALEYHQYPRPGKLGIEATKPMATQQDLALAYSPGVAHPCEEIERDPQMAALYTARGNLVAVISNGTAVLGLGDIGPLASKPVMEGKAVLFKRFADIDVFDIEIDEKDPQKLIETVARLEPTFGGINLEDIKAPDCFIIEEALRAQMKIPVFHDDQHGTAIVVAAAVVNGLRVVGKSIQTVKLTASGAGAAAISCLNLLVSLGLRRENVLVTDRKGVIYAGRDENPDPYKGAYANETDARTLEDAIVGADIFLGLSTAGVMSSAMAESMAERPLILALSNPVPEIMPEEVRKVRSDAVIATGRSDYPNQVNNVLCFPFLFRGALDVGATEINEEMKKACVYALAELATAEPSDVVRAAYGDESLKFGPDYILPKPFDPRLIVKIAPAVAEAAMYSGAATRPIADFNTYRERLEQFVFSSGLTMRPIFQLARQHVQRVVYAEGEEPRVLQAVQQVVNEGLAKPIVVGRPAIINELLSELSLAIKPGKDFEIVDPLDDAHHQKYSEAYHELMGRKGVSPQTAKTVVRADNTVLAALMLCQGDADAMLCGTVGRYFHHLNHISNIIGKAPGVHDLSTMTALVMPKGTFFLCDTHVTPNPTSEEIAEMTVLCAEEIRHFGIEPKAALLSYSNFGTRHDEPSVSKMQEALALIQEAAPDLEVDGEMHADVALTESLRQDQFPHSNLTGEANLLIMPNLDAANIAFNMFKVLGGGVAIGPVMIGAAKSAHVLTQVVTVRGIVNMTAMAAIKAQTPSTVGQEAR
ncbi:MAG: NADP-dependent malic enzyme [Pseudomonadota bacterium]